MYTRQWRATTIAVASLTLCCISSEIESADDVTSPVELLPRWKKDEKLQFEIVKTRVKSQDGKVTLKATTRTELEIKVLKASTDGYIVSWTTGETRFDDPKQEKNALIQHMANLLKGIQIILEIDSDGSIEGVQNWKELKEASTKLLNTWIEEMEKTETDKTTIARVRAQLASMFATKEQIEQMCTREAHLFFVILGKSFPVSKPIEYEDELPNPLGGESFPTHAVFSLKVIDKKSDTAVVTWKQIVDPKKARRIMEKTLKDLALRLGKPVPDGDLLKDLTMEDSAEFSVDVASGWTKRLTHTRTVRSGQGSQIDTTSITRKGKKRHGTGR